MKYINHILSNSPEYYLITVAILAGYSPPFSVNPVAIAVAAIAILQLIFKSKTSGIILASLFLLVNIFMMGALISEFNEFPALNTEAKKMLFGGSLILSFSIIMSILMMTKYVKNVGSPDNPVTFG